MNDEDRVLAEQLAFSALGIVWRDTESQARRVAEHAAGVVSFTRYVGHSNASALRAENDRLRAALRRVSLINCGPDKASGEWRCLEAEAIATEALKDRAPQPSSDLPRASSAGAMGAL